MQVISSRFRNSWPSLDKFISCLLSAFNKSTSIKLNLYAGTSAVFSVAVQGCATTLTRGHRLEGKGEAGYGRSVHGFSIILLKVSG